MQTTKRDHADELTGPQDIVDRLAAEPHRFQFVQAVQILLHQLRRRGITYEQAFRHVLRFQNSLSLNFPAQRD